jgi:hypothetical protein
VQWGGIGLLLGILYLALAAISPNFPYGRNPLEKPILLLVGIEILAGILYLLALSGMREASRDRKLLAWIIVVGAVLRVAMLHSTPMLEDDYYRYLWDGAVVAEGINPYSYAPSAVRETGQGSGTIPSTLRHLAAEAGVVVSRVNHPHLRTIYPPIAQATFALAYRLRPWSIVAWRLVLLLFDCATLVFLILLLRTLGLPVLWLVVYWWNPLLVKEIFNSGHMDVIALPFVLGALLLSIRRKHLSATVSLALAAGVKLWPVVLLPLVVRPLFSKPKRLVTALLLFGLLVGAMVVPVYMGGLDSESGFTAYGRRWEMNDALFMLFVWGAKFALKGVGSHPGYGPTVARGLVLLILAAWIVWVTRRKTGDPVELCDGCMLIVAAVFLLSPTQFPWYYVWLLPLLALRPRPSLLLLTALLPLYYLRFHFSAIDKVGVFDYGIVWLEFVPVWVLLIAEFRGHPIYRFDNR